MAHKGYTLNYYINFFENIPTNKIVTSDIANTLEDKGDIYDHAIGILPGSRYSGERYEALAYWLKELNSLDELNDGKGKCKKLGKTPRTRILRALRNRKRTGSIFGKTN